MAAPEAHVWMTRMSGASANDFRAIVGSSMLHWDGVKWMGDARVPPASYSAIGNSGNDNVWLVGNRQEDNRTVTATAHWDGNAWTQIASPGTKFPADRLNGIAVIGRNDAWAIGNANRGASQQRAFVIHWNGKKWARVKLPGAGGANLKGISAVAADDVRAVGDKAIDGKSVAFIVHWNGKRWRQVSDTRNPEFRAPIRLNAVASIATDDVWAVGASGPDYAGKAFVYHWDGKSWQGVVPPPLEGLEDIVAVSPDEIFVAGGTIARWNGNAWTLEDLPTIGHGTSFLNDVAATSAEDVWIVGAKRTFGYKTTLILHGDGTSWSIVPSQSPSTAAELRGVAVVSPEEAWAVASFLMMPGYIV